MLISFIIQLIALWLLSMAMSKHFRLVFKKPLEDNKAMIFKILGWLLLIMSFFIISNKSIAMVSVYWFSYLALNIFIIAACNAWFSLNKIKLSG